MSFDTASRAMAVAVFNALGDVVTYHGLPAAFSAGFSAGFSGAGGTDIQAIIDKDVETFPDAFDSGNTEQMTQASFLKADVPMFNRDDYIVSGSDIYTIETRINDDGIVVKYAVTLQ